MIQQMKQDYPVQAICRVLDVPVSSACYVSSKRDDTGLLAAAEAILLQFLFYGYRKLSKQYAAWLHTNRLFAHGIHISMSDKGCPQQNGIAERFMRTLKEEHVDYSEYEDFDDAQRQGQHWLEVTYMTQRLHQSLDYLTPAEFELVAGSQVCYPTLSPV
jgi:transposase InsO family protein